MKPLLLGCGIAGHRELVHRRAGDENEVVVGLLARLQAAVARLAPEFWLHSNHVGCDANHIAFAELLSSSRVPPFIKISGSSSFLMKARVLTSALFPLAVVSLPSF